MPDKNYWFETVQFLRNTNIAYLNWELIEYEEEQGIFGKTHDNLVGEKSNTYYAGYYKSKDIKMDLILSMSFSMSFSVCKNKGS